MKINNNMNKSFEIIENAVIIYNDGAIDIFEAIYVDDTEVVFGRIIDKNRFIRIGGIPKINIKDVIESRENKKYKI